MEYATILPPTMHALVIDRPGEAGELHLAEVPAPIAVLDELIVRVIAAGINPIDAKTRAGKGVSAAITGYPAVLGNDFSGIVVSAPYEHFPLQPGDEVYGMARVPRTTGSYAEYLPVSALSVTRKPARLSHAEAAAVPVAALTAWGMVVELAETVPGQRMLIHAGSGGVGHFAVQFAKAFGAHVTATGSTRNLEFLRELGADEVIDYTTTRFDEVVSGLDSVIDLIGNVHDNTGTRSLSMLRPGGILVNAPTGSWPTMAAEAAAAGIRATGYKVAASGRTLDFITELIDDGIVRVHVDRVFDLADGAAAHRLLETGHTRGKIVLRVADAAETSEMSETSETSEASTTSAPAGPRP
ncbi:MULTISPECIES: NADP-dependent oxidoreductase [unclassified Cryobacterium]|uniref:NADP-dependent oxidoreductase n=1 Tax=unclassified Cryobacterium TaxID=2649013 RepID=UPI001F53EE2E|nr:MULTISPECIES: NADP-dependent oxidoreductase [unclassified Cryobacterium]